VGRSDAKERPFMRPVIRLISRHVFTIGKLPVDFRMEVRERSANIAVELRSKWAVGPAAAGREERISESICDRSGSRRTAAGPFSTQPSGPRPVGCFSALLAPYVSI
jgi:hypothetical protein